MEKKDLKLFIKVTAPIMIALYLVFVLCVTKGFWVATLGMVGTLAGVAAMLAWIYYVIDMEERREKELQDRLNNNK